MRLRWSDGYSYAVDFEADPQSLAGQLQKNLEKFMRNTAKYFHDGSDGQNKVNFQSAELHTLADGVWLHVSEDNSSKFVAYGATVLQSDEDEFFDKLATVLLLNSKKILNAVYMSHQRRASLTNWIIDTTDMIKRVVDDDNA